MQDDAFDDAALVRHISDHVHHIVVLWPDQRWTEDNGQVPSIHLHTKTYMYNDVTYRHTDTQTGRQDR